MERAMIDRVLGGLSNLTRAMITMWMTWITPYSHFSFDGGNLDHPLQSCSAKAKVLEMFQGKPSIEGRKSSTYNSKKKQRTTESFPQSPSSDENTFADPSIRAHQL